MTPTLIHRRVADVRFAKFNSVELQRKVIETRQHPQSRNRAPLCHLREVKFDHLRRNECTKQRRRLSMSSRKSGVVRSSYHERIFVFLSFSFSFLSQQQLYEFATSAKSQRHCTRQFYPKHVHRKVNSVITTSKILWKWVGEVSNWKFKKLESIFFIHYVITLLGEHSNVMLCLVWPIL